MSEESDSSSSMISLQRSMHSSQMYTPGPAMSFFTCFWLFPQNEHLSRSPPSPMRATQISPFRGAARPRCDERRALEAFDVGSDVTVSGAVGKPLLRKYDGQPGVHRSPSLRRHYLGSALPACEDVVDQTIDLGLLRGEDLVALDVGPDLLDLSAGVPGDDLLELLADSHDFAGLDLDVARLAVRALGGRLMDQDPRVRQRRPLARRPGGQQHGGGRG